MNRHRPPEDWISDHEQEANNIMIRVSQLVKARDILLATYIRKSKLLSQEQNDTIYTSVQKEIHSYSVRLRELADVMHKNKTNGSGKPDGIVVVKDQRGFFARLFGWGKSPVEKTRAK